MHLSREEERCLAGERGEALAVAYRLLLAAGRLMGAERLIPIESAHVSGVSYLTIGDAGLEFLEGFSQDARVAVSTTVNPCSIDLELWREHGLPEDYTDKQLRIVQAYRRMGILESFTCTPYEGYPLPPRGSHVSWAESSAAIYANSILGLRTNRESGLTALASAVAGKVPLAGLHLDENRRARLIVKVEVEIRGALEMGLLGYFAGTLTDGPIGFSGLRELSKEEAKALAASIGVAGSSGLFLLDPTPDEGVESVSYTKKDREEVLARLDEGRKGDAIILGCPQLLLEEVARLANMVKGRRFRRPCLIFLSRRVHQEAERLGYLGPIRAAGARIIKDACADFTPLVKQLGVDAIITDACKAAYYIKRVHGLSTSLLPLDKILEGYST